MVFSFKNMLKGKIGGGNVGVGNATYKQVQEGTVVGGFPRTLNKATLWAQTGSDITAAAALWTRIGEYTIPAQQVVHLGYGVTGGNPEEIGHLHFDILDDTATNSVAEAGYVRVGYTNSNETLTAVVFEERSEDLSDTSTTVGISRANELLLPEIPPAAKGYPAALAGEDSKLFVDFKSDAADVVVEAAIGTGAVNKWKLPITVYQ